HAIRCASGDVVQGIRPVEKRERPAGLQSNDAAKCEMPRQPHFPWSGSREICYETVASVLVRVGSFGLVIKLVRRKVDERGEVSIVYRVRIGVVGGQAEVLDPLDGRERAAVIRGIGDAVVVIKKPIAHA